MAATPFLEPQEVNIVEKRSKHSVAIIGCGVKGIFFANLFAESGYTVICTDADPSIVKKTAKGKTISSKPELEILLKNNIRKGQISVGSEIKKVVSQSDIIIVTISAVDKKERTDNTQLLNICKQVGSAIQQGTLVIYGGISTLGFIEGNLKEVLENTSGLKVGQSFGLAYCPLLNTNLQLSDLELTVSALDKRSLESASTVLKTVTKKVKEINEIKTAEFVALATITIRDVNTAIANELAIFCENANIDYFKVMGLLGLNEINLKPSILDEEEKNEAYMLVDSSENLNIKLRLPTLARQINEDMLKHAVKITQNTLRRLNKTLRRSKVTILGNTKPESTNESFIRIIEQKGAKVNLYDHSIKKDDVKSEKVKNNLNEAVEGTDCIIIVNWQDQFNRLNIKRFKSLMKSPAAIIDFSGKLDPKKIETEGFIYASLGRGTDYK